MRTERRKMTLGVIRPRRMTGTTAPMMVTTVSCDRRSGITCSGFQYKPGMSGELMRLIYASGNQYYQYNIHNLEVAQ
jgi:hypothetical protein